MAIQIIREVSADVIKRGATKTVYAKQNDLNSRFMNVRIQEEGKDIVIDPGLTVMLNVERPDKSENMFYGTVNADGTVKVPLTTWMLELAGTLVCDVSIVSEDPTAAKLTTMSFNIYVEEAVVSDESITETTEYSVIVNLLNRVEEAERNLPTATVEQTPEGATLSVTDKNGTTSATIFNGPQGIQGIQGEKGDPGGFIETVTQMTMILPQISPGTFSSTSIDYTLVYANSIIIIDVIDCHYNESGDLNGLPVVFSVLPKYQNLQKVEGKKSITAFRMGTNTAKINITLKIHEIKCS